MWNHLPVLTVLTGPQWLFPLCPILGTVLLHYVADWSLLSLDFLFSTRFSLVFIVYEVASWGIDAFRFRSPHLGTKKQHLSPPHSCILEPFTSQCSREVVLICACEMCSQGQTCLGLIKRVSFLTFEWGNDSYPGGLLINEIIWSYCLWHSEFSINKNIYKEM